ncbi:hypothetical protein KGF57_000274 [Candida theae]|uniref:Uncharacterized protein n=1 Tax=Candida theae TaxID=1198502 RepID=A0AAD5BK10_9ASCO|nr:uncharacterized protein KGF57_000274 [Candida theae]KAI5967846.1 hypothetical protein KGF57_000274 [Candida theae]
MNFDQETSSGLSSTARKGRILGSVISQRDVHVADIVDSGQEILIVPVGAVEEEEEKITHEDECDILEVVEIMQEDGNSEATIRITHCGYLNMGLSNMKYAIILLMVLVPIAITQSEVEHIFNRTPEMQEAFNQLKRETCHYNQENKIICTDPLSNVDFECKPELDVQNMDADEALYAAATQYFIGSAFAQNEILKAISSSS